MSTESCLVKTMSQGAWFRAPRRWRTYRTADFVNATLGCAMPLARRSLRVAGSRNCAVTLCISARNRIEAGGFLNDDKQKNTHPRRRLWRSLRRFKTRKIDGTAARVGSDARHPGELFSVYSDAPRSCGGGPRVEHDCQSAAQAA